ncbi:Dihydropyrimidinase-related protein 4 [Manis javanica]|nr:Dihydropyrimidinase-related protein 4 [Manis javanica]
MGPGLTPARSPRSARKFVRESTLGALQLRHRGGVGIGGGPEIGKLGRPAPNQLQKRLPPAPLSDPTLRDRTPYPSRAHHPPCGLGSSDLREKGRDLKHEEDLTGLAGLKIDGAHAKESKQP